VNADHEGALQGGLTVRRTVIGLLGSIALLGSTLCCRQAENTAATELGHGIAGTWLGTCEFGPFGPGETAFIRTYHPDGTGMTTSSRALGAGDPLSNGLSTTHHLQWEEAGPRAIRWRILHFGHDADGNLVYISRTHGMTEFDEEFESWNETFQVEVFEPHALLEPMNPNDPDAEPSATGEGTCKAKRLHIRIP
jgi:hypothetical protein